MLLKDAVGIEGGLGVDYFLISDLFLLALSATLPLSLLRWLASASAVGSGFDVGNLPTLLNDRTHGADSFVIGLSNFGDLSITLSRICFQQLRDQVSFLFSTEVSALNVHTDDEGARVLAGVVSEVR